MKKKPMYSWGYVIICPRKSKQVREWKCQVIMLWNELPNWGAVEATNIYYQIHINKFPAFSVLDC